MLQKGVKSQVLKTPGIFLIYRGTISVRFSHWLRGQSAAKQKGPELLIKVSFTIRAVGDRANTVNPKNKESLMIYKIQSTVVAISRGAALLLATTIFTLSTGVVRAEEAVFYGFGTLGGSYSWTEDLSADGSVAVGVSATASAEIEAFIWTFETGMVGLGTLGGNWSSAHGVSADGSTVVGDSQDELGQWRAFRWTADEGMVEL
jgi:probable HAF family extracellular repeat protein